VGRFLRLLGPLPQVVAFGRDPSFFPHITKRNTMNNDSSTPSTVPSYVDRVINNEAAKKGLAAAGAGILVALISEALWPTR
jgi:hypothetical protein